MSEDVQFNLRIPSELKQQIVDAAKRNSRFRAPVCQLMWSGTTPTGQDECNRIVRDVAVKACAGRIVCLGFTAVFALYTIHSSINLHYSFEYVIALWHFLTYSFYFIVHCQRVDKL